MFRNVFPDILDVSLPCFGICISKMGLWLQVQIVYNREQHLLDGTRSFGFRLFYIYLNHSRT